MTHERIRGGPGVPVPAAPYSAAVIAGDTCFISGQTALNPRTGELQQGTAAEEITQALANLLSTARAAGFESADIAYVNVLLTDIDDFAEINRAYAEAFEPTQLPARMTFAVAGLPGGALVEVQAIAVRGTPRRQARGDD